VREKCFVTYDVGGTGTHKLYNVPACLLYIPAGLSHLLGRHSYRHTWTAYVVDSYRYKALQVSHYR